MPCISMHFEGGRRGSGWGYRWTKAHSLNLSSSFSMVREMFVLERAHSRTSRIFYRTVHFHQVFGNVLILCNACNILWSDEIAHYCLPAITRTIQHNTERLYSIPWCLGYVGHFQMNTGRVTCNVLKRDYATTERQQQQQQQQYQHNHQ